MLLQIVMIVVVLLVIPIIGVAMFWRTLCKMKDELGHQAPGTQLFLLFAHYGIILLLMLTTVLWGWSGMSSLGLIYLLFVSPLFIIPIITSNAKKTGSGYYRYLQRAAVYFYPIMIVSFVPQFFFDGIIR